MSDAKTAFLARVSTQSPDECWQWTSVLSAQGYGVFKFKQVRTGAHRWAYLNFVGPVPDGLVLDHVCHSRDKSCTGGPSCIHLRCVNPAHLEPVTTVENVRRGRGPDYWRRRTHCAKGHEYTEANTALEDGHRRCRKCNAQRAKKRPPRLGTYVRKNEVPAEIRTQVNELRDARLRAGLSQDRLAVIVGCAGSSITRWEAHKIAPSPTSLAKWSAALADA